MEEYGVHINHTCNTGTGPDKEMGMAVGESWVLVPIIVQNFSFLDHLRYVLITW